MKPYILLTPGPLTTSETVKEAMLTDWCTWDADYNVGIVEEIRKSLVGLATKQNILCGSCYRKHYQAGGQASYFE